MPVNTKSENSRCNTGQLTLFDLEKYTNYDETQEPPDPDHYQKQEAYEYAWQQWEKQYPDLVKYVVAMSPYQSVGGQETADTSLPPNTTNNQVAITTKKIAPQHETTQWVEKYWVERSSRKYWYWRYCWMTGRKIHRRYIGSVTSPKARDRKSAIEEAINFERSPKEIEKLIHSWRELKK
ncbi:DUF4102 domain-containing protein [Nostoc sp. FACHB-87]|uniref:DUF4102 domain-containing protein n=1 Tax=Nostocaceae TaxID=1162 RepID=UPI00168485F0|nr:MULTISPECIES: DUF4102 domain-containing protein [Nostocaceae]MBD2453077.1 DUF4102 domain-containing protein [Nostoc sp. FACHB-87]MBD2475144.1 DUF4102 domain-containing protein [Anabaena sp. FACHB-83]